MPISKLKPGGVDRRPCFLVKDPTAESGWRVDKSGRRPSKLLLVQKLRATVDHWREGGYAGASDVTQRLFAYWFEEDHEVAGFPVPFRYHFCPRPAYPSRPSRGRPPRHP